MRDDSGHNVGHDMGHQKQQGFTAMNKKSAAPEHINKALSLDGSVAALKAYYATWAASYDSDLAGDYTGASVLCHFFQEIAFGSREDGASVLPEPGALPTLRIADVGCGTGHVGRVLYEQGVRVIDGMDLSPEMISQAARLQINGVCPYRALYADIDLNQPLPVQWQQAYDVTFCCGVFTLGHVHPTALNHLAAITRPRGLVMVSTRTTYYEASDYREVSDQLVASGVISLVARLENAPYTQDSDAHYWAYQVN